MTAQISDSVLYRGEHRAIAGVHGKGPFDPEDHGIRTVPISTACWRGFHCAYEVADGALCLIKLNFALPKEEDARARRGEGPLLFGRVPRHYTLRYIGQRMDLRTGEDGPEQEFVHESNDLVIDELREPIAFSGGLLLGHDFDWGLYVHMGHHPAWKYREVHELIFEHGRLVSERDCSARMAEIRAGIASQPLQPDSKASRKEIMRWIAASFSLDYT